MARKKHPTPHKPGLPDGWPGRFLNRIVAESGAPEELRKYYFRFATEFYHSIRRRPEPDFEEITKRVVMKWFKRGLSGKLLWQIGSAILAWRYPPLEFLNPGLLDPFRKED